MSIVIVDTGVANLASVRFAFDRLGITSVISDEANVITSADRVLIPGVGAAPFAMQKINQKGLTPILKSLSQPVMGICLGMQLIFETLEEGGKPIKGLGLVPGTVSTLDTRGQPSPIWDGIRYTVLKMTPYCQASMIMITLISFIALPRRCQT